MMGLLSSIGKGIAKVLDVATVAVAHPVQTATAIVSKKTTVQDVVSAHFAQPLKEQIKDIVLGTAGIATSVLGGAAVGAAAKAGTLAPKIITAAKSLIPSTLTGKITAAVAAPVVVGAVSREPAKTIEAAIKAPSELAQFGGDIASFAAAPSIESGKKIIEESPLISAALATAGVITVGKAALPAIAISRQTGAIKEQTEAIIAGGAKTIQPIGEIKVIDRTSEFIPSPAPSADNLAAITPTLPETSKISTKVPTKRKKRIKRQIMPSVSQKVNVVVANKSSSFGIKKYIKREVLAV